MTPTEEATYLRGLAQRIATDTRYGHNARDITAAILTGHADHLQRGDFDTQKGGVDRDQSNTR